jgi:outer membrane lipoprotein LolB
MYIQITIILLSALLITGCASKPIAPSDFAPPQQEQAEHITDWKAQGKFSLKQPDEAFSARMSWVQSAPDTYEIALVGPLGQGGILLKGNENSVKFQDPKGNISYARDGQALLQQKTGWSIPIESLYYWARGLADPHYPQKSAFNEKDELIALKQHGWILAYGPYQQYDGYTIPRKITLTHQNTRITLLLTQWQINTHE